MKFNRLLSGGLIGLGAWLFAAEPPSTQPTTRPAEGVLHFRFDQPVLSSAGVFDGKNRLIRVLWTMKLLPAGEQIIPWDGLTDAGEAAPAGDYSFRVIVNGCTYRNVGAIGNSGKPASAAGHTPTNMESVAVDATGAIYTANGWDEAGADFKKWTPDGQSAYDANFSIRNGKPNGAPYAIAVDGEYLYCAVGGWDREPWNNRQLIQRFKLADGKPAPFTGEYLVDGHISVYEWASKRIAADIGAAETRLMGSPLRAIAVAGETLYVADALEGRIRKYDKRSGDGQGSFAVSLPSAIAIDTTGRVWVGHEHHKVTVFDAGGGMALEALNELGEIQAMAFSAAGQLYIADGQAGHVKVYDVGEGEPRLLRTLGQKAQPGDRAADRFFELCGVAVGLDGNIVTIQKDPPGGARLAKWNPEGRLIWEHFGTEFVSLGNYGVHEPDVFYSMSHKQYRLTVPNEGKWEYIANAHPEGRSYRSDPHGVLRVLKLGEGAFVFMPMGDGVQVYRAEGRVHRLAAMVGGRDPMPDGADPDGKPRNAPLRKWAWSDEDGDGIVDEREVRYLNKPAEERYGCFGMDVDEDGNVVFADTASHQVVMIPLTRLNERGNPVYDWAGLRTLVPADQSNLGFEPTMAQRSHDGSVYAFGWSKRWPSPKDNPFWMGGTTLARFSANGERLWAVKLPDVCVGLDVIPGAAGCMVGKGKAADILHYAGEGLLIGAMKPGIAMNGETGWMDNHASVAVNRNPRDNQLDIFAEDDYVCRIGWYRVDDKATRVVTGRIERK